MQIDAKSRTNNRIGMKLKIGLAIAMIGIIGAVAVRSSGPWRSLRAKYPGPDLENLWFGRGTIELRNADKAGTVIHSESILSEWGPASVQLGMRRPMGLFLRPIEIPAAAISKCERRQMSGTNTSGIELWVQDLGIGVGFPILDQATVLKWCREHDIQVVGEAGAQ